MTVVQKLSSSTELNGRNTELNDLSTELNRRNTELNDCSTEIKP